MITLNELKEIRSKYKHFTSIFKDEGSDGKWEEGWENLVSFYSIKQGGSNTIDCEEMKEESKSPDSLILKQRYEGEPEEDYSLLIFTIKKDD